MSADHTAEVLAVLETGARSIGMIAEEAFPEVDGLDAWQLAIPAVEALVADGRLHGPRTGLYSIRDPQSVEVQAEQRRALDVMRPIAEGLKTDLGPLAMRLEIAGSIRRGKDQVHDIELCALVEPAPALFHLAQDAPDLHLRDALVARAQVVVKSGSKYTQVILDDPAAGGVAVDLFQTVAPHQWGMMYFIRTGSADFVKRALGHWKTLSNGGYCAANQLRFPDGTLQQTPEEADVFAALHCPFVDPERRIPK